MKRGRPKHNDLLTPREWEVLELLRQGLTNEGIAERLSITANTGKCHVSEILAKLDLPTREQAAAWQPPSRAFGGLTMPLRAWVSSTSGALKVLAGGAALAAGLTVLVVAFWSRPNS